MQRDLSGPEAAANGEALRAELAKLFGTDYLARGNAFSKLAAAKSAPVLAPQRAEERAVPTPSTKRKPI
jgi:hypothetical protein